VGARGARREGDAWASRLPQVQHQGGAAANRPPAVRILWRAAFLRRIAAHAQAARAGPARAAHHMRCELRFFTRFCISASAVTWSTVLS